MADNVTTNPGVGGAKIATDEVGAPGSGDHYQKIKLVDGTADSTTPIAGDAANGLDVDVTRTPKIGVAGVGDGSPKDVVGATAPGTRLVAADTSLTRKRVEIINSSDVTVYLKLGSSASNTDWQIPLSPGQSWWDDVYVGEVRAIHTATGNKQVGVITL